MQSYQEKLAIVDPSKRRKHLRRRVLWSGHIRVGDEHLDCQIRNISLGGVLLKSSIPLAVGTIVYLEHDGHTTLRGRVAWQANNLIGVTFDSTPDQVAEALGDSADKLSLSRPGENI